MNKLLAAVFYSVEVGEAGRSCASSRCSSSSPASWSALYNFKIYKGLGDACSRWTTRSSRGRSSALTTLRHLLHPPLCLTRFANFKAKRGQAELFPGQHLSAGLRPHHSRHLQLARLSQCCSPVFLPARACRISTRPFGDAHIFSGDRWLPIVESRFHPAHRPW